MPASRESYHERKGNEVARSLGWMTVKIIGQPGWPDRLYFRDRVYLWCEWKAPTGRLSPLQAKRIRDLQNAGEHVIVLDDWTQLALHLNRLGGENT